MDVFPLFSAAVKKIPFTYANMLLKSVNPGNAKTIIDIGCGKGGIMTVINEHNNFHSIGIDTFHEYLLECKKKETHDELVRCDIRFLPFRDMAVDIAFCCEVIEHLEKDDGLALINEMERVSSDKIVITTPVGFKEKDEEEENPFQRHRSGWQPEDFKSRGFKVHGQGFRFYGEILNERRKKEIRTLAVEEGKHSIADNVLLIGANLINLGFFVVRPFVYYMPKHAIHIFCTKTKK